MNKILNFLKKRCLLTMMIIVAMACSAFAQMSKVATIGYKNSSMAAAPTFNTTPTATTVDYGNLYSYRATASQEGDLETTITAPTLPPWMTLTQDGASNAALFGNVPAGVPLSGVAGDDNGNIFAIRTDGTEIYKIAPDGTTTSWRSGLISGNVYNLHIANGYIYIPRYSNPTNSITRIPLNNPSAAEENFASLPGGALSLTDKDGWIYALDYTYGQISRINETTRAQELLLTPANGIPSNQCLGLTFDHNNNLLITVYYSGSILKYNGSIVTTAFSGVSGVSSILEDAQGNFYVTAISGGVRKYTADFSSYEVVSLTGTEYVWNSTFTSNGSYVYNIFGSNQVYRLQKGVIIQGTPAKSDVGDHPVVLRAGNSSGYTEQSFTITVEDNVGPVITTYSPVRNTTEIDLHPTLSISFDEEVSLGATGTFDIYNGATLVKSFDLSVPAERALLVVSPDQKTVSLTPTENLPHNTLLSVGISAGFVKDVYDNNFIGFTSASNTWRFTTMNKFDQTITYPVIASKTYGNAPFILGDANTNRGLTVTYTAEDPTVVRITGNQATILKAGNTKITATQIGDYYDFALTPIERTLEVTKAPLTVTADAKTKCYDAAVYSGYTVTYSGFVNGEDQAVLGGALTFNGTAIDAVNPNTYSIVPTGLTSDNYNITFVNGTLVINPLPEPVISGPSSICAGSTTAVYATVASMSQYVWSVSDGGTITSGAGTREITVSWTLAGQQRVLVTATNANGCSATDIKMVDVTALPTATLDEDVVICAGSSHTVSVALTGNAPWSISYTDGSFSKTVNGILKSPYTFTASPEVNTTKTYTVINVSDVNGCSNTGSGQAVITALPGIDTNPVVSAGQTICFNSAPAELSATPAHGGSGVFTYQWQKKTTDTWTNVGTDALSYQPEALTTTTWFRLSATDKEGLSCGAVLSNEIAITVKSITSPGTLSADQLLAPGAKPATIMSMTAGSGDGAITYFWESSADKGLSWETIPGATSPDYAPATPNQPTWYRRVTVSTENSVVCTAATEPVKINLWATGIENPGNGLGILSAYAVRNTEICLKGEVSKQAVATLYDIQGRVVVVKNLEEGSLNTIPTPYIKTGVYLLFVKDNQQIHKFKIPVKE